MGSIWWKLHSAGNAHAKQITCVRAGSKMVETARAWSRKKNKAAGVV
jgi:hypothetical protein